MYGRDATDERTERAAILVVPPRVEPSIAGAPGEAMGVGARVDDAVRAAGQGA